MLSSDNPSSRTDENPMLSLIKGSDQEKSTGLQQELLNIHEENASPEEKNETLEKREIKFIRPSKKESPIKFSDTYVSLEGLYFSDKTIKTYFSNKRDLKALSEVDSVKMVNCRFSEGQAVKLFFQLLKEKANISRIKFKDMDILPLFVNGEIFDPYHYKEISFQGCKRFNEVNPKYFATILLKHQGLRYLNIVNCKLNGSFIKEMFTFLNQYNDIPLLKELNLSENRLYRNRTDIDDLENLYTVALRLTTLNMLKLQNTGIPLKFLEQWENAIVKSHDIQILGGDVLIAQKKEADEPFNEESDSDEDEKSKCCSRISCTCNIFSINFFKKASRFEEQRVRRSQESDSVELQVNPFIQ